MRILICCMFFALSLAGFPVGRAQKNPSPTETLQRPIPGDEVEYLGAADAFHASLQRSRLPGGMVRLLNCEPDALRQAWRPRNNPLNEVLDTIISADPRYRWEAQDGVVNLLPATGEPSLLGTPLPEFDLEEVSSASEALNRIIALPQVKRRMAQLHLKTGVTLVKTLSAPHPPKFSVRYGQGTFRTALNAIARAEGRAVWEYIETHCDGKNEVVIRF